MLEQKKGFRNIYAKNIKPNVIIVLSKENITVFLYEVRSVMVHKKMRMMMMIILTGSCTS